MVAMTVRIAMAPPMSMATPSPTVIVRPPDGDGPAALSSSLREPAVAVGADAPRGFGVETKPAVVATVLICVAVMVTEVSTAVIVTVPGLEVGSLWTGGTTTPESISRLTKMRVPAPPAALFR